MKRKLTALLLTAALALSFTACQNTVAVEPEAPAETFTNLTGSVTFKFGISDDHSMDDPTVVKVTPHHISSDDARTVATALLGNAEFEEWCFDSQLSKTDIQNRLDVWQKYDSIDAVQAVYGSDTDADSAFDILNTLNRFITNYTKKLETAPDTVPSTSCDFSFHPASYYWRTEAYEKENLEIQATTEVGGIPYRLSISTRDEDDFKIQNIFVFINEDNTPTNLHYYIHLRQACGTGEPTSQQILDVKEKAEQMLNSMNLGQWDVDSCYAEPVFGEADNVYRIKVYAVPVLDDKSVIRQEQIGNLKSDHTNASNYYLTDAELEFAADGTLLYADIRSPIDILETDAAENLLSMAELNEIAKTELAKKGWQTYAHNTAWEATGKTYTCEVNVTGAEYGLTRMKGENDSTYYYVPAVTYTGSYQAYESVSGEPEFDSAEWWNDPNRTLLVLNAADGSVITASNPLPGE